MNHHEHFSQLQSALLNSQFLSKETAECSESSIQVVVRFLVWVPESLPVPLFYLTFYLLTILHLISIRYLICISHNINPFSIALTVAFSPVSGSTWD